MSFFDNLRGAFKAPNAEALQSAGPRRLLFGDSHVHAIQEAIRHRENAGCPVPVEARRLLKQKSKRGDPPDQGLGSQASTIAGRPSWLSRLSGAKVRRDDQPAAAAEGVEDAPLVTIGDTSFEDFLVIARSLGPADILVSAVGGNQHAVVSTIQHPTPFDFALPGDPSRLTDENVEMIPFRSMYNFFVSGVRHRDGESLAALRAATKARIIHLPSPPPKADNDFIIRYHDTQFATRGIAVTGVSPPNLRLKFWRLQNQVLGEVCEELGIEMLPVPEEACDADGFLARDYYAKDATHANEAYGELVLLQLENRFDRAVAA